MVVGDRRHVRLHHNDEVKQIEQSGWGKKKKNDDLGTVLVAHGTAALPRRRLEKNFRIAVDTADFVRHVPVFRPEFPSPRFKAALAAVERSLGRRAQSEEHH